MIRIRCVEDPGDGQTDVLLELGFFTFFNAEPIKKLGRCIFN
jgi:hypothetical protein